MHMHIYHIYSDRPFSSKWIVKPPSKKSILYTLKSDQLWGSGSTGRFLEHIATIEHGARFYGYSSRYGALDGENTPYLLHSHNADKFDFAGHRYYWDEGELLEDTTGNIVARFQKTGSAFKKIGTLSIANDNVRMLDVIIATALALEKYRKGLGRNWDRWLNERHENRYAGMMPSCAMPPCNVPA